MYRYTPNCDETVRGGALCDQFLHQSAGRAYYFPPEDAGAKRKRAYNVRCRGPLLLPRRCGNTVLLQRRVSLPIKFTRPWVGAWDPARCLGQLSDAVYRVKLCVRGRVVALHRGHLAPYRPQVHGRNPQTNPAHPAQHYHRPATCPARLCCGQWGALICDPTDSGVSARETCW